MGSQPSQKALSYTCLQQSWRWYTSSMLLHYGRRGVAAQRPAMLSPHNFSRPLDCASHTDCSTASGSLSSARVLRHTQRQAQDASAGGRTPT